MAEQKGILKNFQKDESIVLNLNPSEIKIETKCNFAPKSGLGSNKIIVQFVNKLPSLLKTSLDFDVDFYEGQTSKVGQVYSFLNDTIHLLYENEDGSQTPSKIQFSWGDINFSGYLSSCKFNLRKFSSEGKLLGFNAEIEIIEAM